MEASATPEGLWGRPGKAHFVGGKEGFLASYAPAADLSGAGERQGLLLIIEAKQRCDVPQTSGGKKK